MSKKKIDFVRVAREVHGDKYDYSKAEYVKMHDKVTIICPIHGEFQQTPHSHLRGQGCPKCGVKCRSRKRMDTLDNFIKKAIEVHGDKYDYSKAEYNGSQNKICIICPKHGMFWQKPYSHLRGQGCPICNKERLKNRPYDTLDGFIEKARKVHGDIYDYSKTEYVNSQTKVCIICPKHGEFWQKPNNHLQGCGCQKCGIEKSHIPMTTDEFIEKAKKVHGDLYDYSKAEYHSPYSNITIICKTHGEFKQKASCHLSGNGCKECGYEKVKESLCDKKEDFILKSKAIYRDLYDYSKVEYINNKTDVTLVCKKHGDFKVRPDNHLNGRNGCPNCSNNHSLWENEIFEFIKSFGIECINGDKTVLDGKELDIYVPSLKIAIECDGLRWHSELFKDNNYHLHKLNKCKEKGIRLIHIFEDEWLNKSDIVKSRLKSILGVVDWKIYARNCEVREVPSSDSIDFLSTNHIQGKIISKYNIGLYYNDELVSLMTFGKLRKNLGSVNIDESYELLRFCNKLDINVVGGASKLMKYFISTIKPNNITSYCDLRWSDGNLYEKIGFKLDHTSQPNYFYIVNNTRKNRFAYRKDILVNEGYDPNKTEHEIMLERGIYRIYDCGCKVYKLQINGS